MNNQLDFFFPPFFSLAKIDPRTMFSDVRQVRDSNTCQEEEDVQIVSDDANR
jgi:hypothetical protein